MTKQLLPIFILISLGAPCLAYGGVYKSTTNFEPQSRQKKIKSNFSGDIGFQTNGLLENVGEVPGNEYSTSLNFKYESLSKTQIYKKLEFRGKINDQETFEYSVKEAFWDIRYSTSRLAIGRAPLEWSHVDEVWGLGKINNRVNFDYFEPDQEGLVGFFYDRKFGSGVDFSLFTSFLYVPELSQGLIVDKSQGTVQCRSAWCSAPSASAQVEGQEVPIFYDVNEPKISDVVLKDSLGIKLGYTYTRLYVNWFYMRKPENTMTVSAEVSVASDLSVINAKVTPQFFNHDIHGSNFELTITDKFKFYGSTISIVPNKFPHDNGPLIQYTGIKPKKKREDYVSGGAFYNDESLSLQAGYIARVSEFDTESDILVNYPRWNQAVHFSLNKEVSDRASLFLDYKYDMLTEDRLTMFKMKYRVGRNFAVALGISSIGTLVKQESFWTKYDNNDSAYTSINYKF